MSEPKGETVGVFVANRGEIAVRIVRAAREAGLEAVVAVTVASPNERCSGPEVTSTVCSLANGTARHSCHSQPRRE